MRQKRYKIAKYVSLHCNISHCFNVVHKLKITLPKIMEHLGHIAVTWNWNSCGFGASWEYNL